MLRHSTLRPGLLISLKTSISGGVNYQKEVIEGEHVTDDGSQKARWETTRTIVDPKEHERATKARGKAGSIIRSVCAQSAFGLICPESDADKLEKAIADARKVADDFNETAAVSRVTVYVLTGRIAADDVEAVKAINSEVKELMDLMQQGIETLDVKKVRDAASRAKEVSNVLSPDAQARVQIAIDASREVARAIVKAGEAAEVEIDQAAVRRIREQRSAFLDLDSDTEITAPVVRQSRVVDLSHS